MKRTFIINHNDYARSQSQSRWAIGILLFIFTFPLSLIVLIIYGLIITLFPKRR